MFYLHCDSHFGLVDGLVVAPTAPHDAEHLADFVRRGIPLVLLDRGAPDIAADAVVVDNVRAVYNAVSHLVRLGHRRRKRRLGCQPRPRDDGQPGRDPPTTSVCRARRFPVHISA